MIVVKPQVRQSGVPHSTRCTCDKPCRFVRLCGNQNPRVFRHRPKKGWKSCSASIGVYPEIAIARPRCRQITDAQHQRCLIRLVRDVAHRLPLDAQRRATAPFAHGMGRLDVRDELASSSRRQSFFDRTSCKMCLSRLRSATSCFSCRFSSSSCFRRLNSPTPRPPYTFFQR